MTGTGPSREPVCGANRLRKKMPGDCSMTWGAISLTRLFNCLAPPQQVYAEMEQQRSGALVDDDTFVALTFAQGVHAHLWMSVIARRAGPRFRVSGLCGTYEKWGLDLQEDALRSGRRPGDPEWGKEPDVSGIHPGDMLVVDRALPLTGGSIVLAVIANGLLLRRLRRTHDLFVLVTDTRYLPSVEVQPSDIWGVVAYVIHRLKK